MAFPTKGFPVRRFPSKGFGVVVGESFDSFSFIAAYKGSTDVQNVNVDGEICNLMPKGTVTATSTHSTPILAPDVDGVYREYPIDAPVWKEGRVVLSGEAGSPVDETYSTDSGGQTLVPQPYLQANKAATNLCLHSNNLGDGSWISQNSPIVAFNQVGLEEQSNTASYVEDNAITHQSIYRNIDGFVIGDITVLRVFIKKTGLISYRPSVSCTCGATPQWTYLLLNTQTGAAIESTISNEFGVPFEVVDAGNWWMCLIEKENASDGSNKVGVFPALTNLIDDGAISATQGSCIVGNIDVIKGKTLKEVKELPPIITTTAAALIPATNYTFPAANLDPSNLQLTFSLDMDEVDGDVLDIGGGGLTLSVLTGDLVLSDGTNSVSLTVANGLRDVKIYTTATTMLLDVDGIEASGSYIPPAAGLITVSKNIWALRNQT